MKSIYIIFGVVAIAGIVCAFWLALSYNPFSEKSTETTSVPLNPFPLVTTDSNQSTNPQYSSPYIQLEIAQDLVEQIPGAGSITLTETVAVSEYALQVWRNEHMGGEALLKYDASTKTWKLVSMGGGAWSISGLVDFGVPQPIAEQLLSKARSYWKD